jgi:hypothetical protein
MKRPFETWILIVLLVLLAINAFYGGISLMLAPDGSLLGMQPGWLEKSPFKSYFIPGFPAPADERRFPFAGALWPYHQKPDLVQVAEYLSRKILGLDFLDLQRRYHQHLDNRSATDG